MENKKVREFGMLDKIAYMSGDIANDLSFIFVSMYLLVFYTKVLGLSGATVGTLFLTARIVDAFTDIGMGRILDGMQPKKEGKFRFWIKAVSPFVCISAFLLFVYIVKDFSAPIKIAYVFITYILWGSVFYTGINIPYGSMASVISAESEHRASLSVFRSLGASISIFFISMVVPKVIYVSQIIDGKPVQVVIPHRFTILAAVFAILAFCFYLFCYNFSVERVTLTPKKQVEKKSFTAEFKDLVSSLKTNKSLQAFILVAITLLLTSMLGQGLAPYLYADYFDDTSLLGIHGALGSIATFVLSVFAAKIARIFGKRLSGGVSLIFTAVVFVILFFMNITTASTFIKFYFVSVLGASFFNIIVWAFISDIIDDQEVREGKREDGTVYAAYSFARKLGQALAGGLTGFALSAIGYQSINPVQTQEVRDAIYSLFTAGSAIGYLVCGLLLLFVYPLGKKRVEANTQEIMRRRGQTNVGE